MSWSAGAPGHLQPRQQHACSQLDGEGTGRTRGHNHRPAGPTASGQADPRFGALIALIASQLSNRQPRANTANGVTGYDQATLLQRWAVQAFLKMPSTNRDHAMSTPPPRHLPSPLGT